MKPIDRRTAGSRQRGIHMKKKEIMGRVAAVMLTVSFFVSGCAAGDVDTGLEETGAVLENAELSPGTGMKFTALAGMNGGYSLNDNLAMKVAMQNANILIDFRSVLGDDLTEKRISSLASGNYPDMFFKTMFEGTELEKYGKQGIFIPLEDLIRKYAPNLTARLDEMDGWDYLKASDGNIYSFPEIDRPSPAGAVLWINKRWMDNLGLEEPADFEELYQVLKAFRDQDANGNKDPGDEIPLSMAGSVYPLLAYADYGYDYISRTAVIDGELVYLPTDGRFKEFIRYVARLYQEGLLDRDTFVQQRKQLEAVGRSGDILGAFDCQGAFEVVGRGRNDYIALTPFQEGTYPIKKGITLGAAVITNKCRHPEALVAWLDQFYDEAGGILAWMGVEGETYRMNEDGSWGWITDKEYGKDVSAVRAGSTIQGAQYHPSIQPKLWDALSEEQDPDEVYLTQEHLKIVGMGAVPLPIMKYSEAEGGEILALSTDMNAYIDRYVVQVATGELDLEESWEEYLNVLQTMEVDRLIEIYQKAYEETAK